jgi:hypothetical protein
LFSTIVRQPWTHAALVAVFLLAPAAQSRLMAQGLGKEGAIDTIIGSDVTVEEEKATASEERIVAAIERSAANAAEVRKKFSLDNVEIILLTDIGGETGPIGTKLKEYEPQVTELRESIQGSAMFYHAVDSRSIMLNRIVALEFDDHNGVRIFVSRGLLRP